MARVVPSQAIRVIDELFPHIARGHMEGIYTIGEMAKLHGVLTIIQNIAHYRWRRIRASAFGHHEPVTKRLA